MHRYLFHRLWLLLLLAAGTSSCVNERPATAANPTPPAEWLAWRDKRHESIAGTNGWATLVGRHWLNEGPNYAGSDPTNQAVLPQGRAAANIGVFTREGRKVRFEAAPGVVATIEGRPVQTAELQSDRLPQPTRLQIGTLSIVVIERGERLGLRVRDPQAPARVHFTGLKYFPYDPAWRVNGRFEPFATVRKLRVPDIIGDTQEFPSPGAIVFSHEGREYRLDVAEETGEDDYFVMFHDLTAGDSTYDSGRFLQVARPDAQSRVVIDFNRAYTPPCGFTEFATCPLPPRQNWLPFPLRAGELKPAGH
jgi:uncharacterized protein (DUF1684 family)